jgi:hypothetical protein
MMKICCKNCKHWITEWFDGSGFGVCNKVSDHEEFCDCYELVMIHVDDESLGSLVNPVLTTKPEFFCCLYEPVS